MIFCCKIKSCCAIEDARTSALNDSINDSIIERYKQSYIKDINWGEWVADCPPETPYDTLISQGYYMTYVLYSLDNETRMSVWGNPLYPTMFDRKYFVGYYFYKRNTIFLFSLNVPKESMDPFFQGMILYSSFDKFQKVYTHYAQFSYLFKNDCKCLYETEFRPFIHEYIYSAKGSFEFIEKGFDITEAYKVMSNIKD